jgi:energy-coupling factor transporter ATP-binding protein EcfA2
MAGRQVPKTSIPILKIERLCYRYPGGQMALRDVSLQVGLREAVGIVGPNGAGKTTLLLHFNGLLQGTRAAPHPVQEPPRAADDGGVAVEVLGMPIHERTVHEARKVVGMLFQDPDDQLFCATVGDDVAFGPRNLGFPEAEVMRRVERALTAVGLPGFERRLPQELSLGERKRVALAGVIACEPNLLALDEPSSSLDPRARRMLMQILKAFPGALVIASHDLELILELCARVVVLDGGMVRADGPTERILADEALLTAHGLEVPLSIRYGAKRKAAAWAAFPGEMREATG